MATTERVLAYLDSQIHRCFHCAYADGDPYAYAYRLVENPTLYKDIAARKMRHRERIDGLRKWHTIYFVRKVGKGVKPYWRSDCHYKGECCASGRVTEDRICWNCKKSVDE